MTGILQLSQISASNAAGLKLYNNNNNGILIQDNGDVSFSNNISASAAQFITNK
jgi:hypothetical protein